MKSVKKIACMKPSECDNSNVVILVEGRIIFLLWNIVDDIFQINMEWNAGFEF